MPVFDSLQRASFSGIAFPVRSVSVTGQYRHHTHEYLRVPGGVNEKLERGLYKIEMDAPFHATIKGYGDLWPTALANMRALYEAGVTAALTIPTIGTIQAFQTDWNQMADMGKVRSGETAKLVFLEDQTQVHLTAALSKVAQNSLQSANDNFTATRADFDVPAPDASIFDEIQELGNAVLGFQDQTQLAGGLLSAKIAQILNLLNQADRQAESLQDPSNYVLLDSLHELWDAALTIGKNLSEKPRGARRYTTPRTMTVSEIAVATQKLGGDDDAATILLNNPVEDAFAVPAGFPIIYFLAA